MRIWQHARRCQVVLAAAVMAAGGIINMSVVRAATPATPSAESQAKALIVDLLVDAARRRARDTTLPRELAIKEDLVLLQMAYARDNSSPELLLLLEEAAESGAAVAQSKGDAALVATDIGLAKQALLDLLKVDPGHLWAQVRLLDLITRDMPVDEKLKKFHTVLDDAQDFDPQVRSEVAVRIGRLLLERDDVDGAIKVLQQATVLNDVNVAAWQELAKLQVKMQAPAPERMKVFVKLLLANPFQPDVWIAGAHILSAAGEHDKATDWFIAGVEQINISGSDPGLGIYSDLATEMGLANRRVEATKLMDQLMQRNYGPNVVPPSIVPSIAYVIKSAGLLPGPAGDPMLVEAQKRLSAAVNAEVPKDNKDALAAHNNAIEEAVWFDLFAAPDITADDVAGRMQTLKGILGETNPIYQRLDGWFQLRSGKYDEGKAILTPLANADAFATLGLVRIARLQHDDATAGELINKLWDVNPTGIAALCVQGEAGRLNIAQPVTPLTLAIRDVIKTVPQSLMTAHRTPRELVLIDPALPKRTFEFGEPIALDVKFVNSTDRALSVGDNGAVNTSIVVGGTLRGLEGRNLGIFAAEDNPRVFRVERRATIQERVRVDQMVLRELMYYQPTSLISVTLNVTTAPRQTSGGYVEGLSGQKVQAGDFDRKGMAVLGSDSIMAITDMIRTLASKPVNERMLIAGALQSLTYNLPQDQTDIPTGAPGAATGPAASQPGTSLAQIRADAIKTLADQIKNGDPMVQAWLIRWAPANLPAGIDDAMNTMFQTATDPIVRLLAYNRTLDLVRTKQAEREDLGRKLTAMVPAEKDELLKQWMELLAQEAAIVPPAAPAGQ